MVTPRRPADLALLTAASTQQLWVWFESGAAFISDKQFVGVCAPGIYVDSRENGRYVHSRP